MIAIMILSGLLSSMYIWADKVSDIRLSVNDIYMILLMTSWMCLFMSIHDGIYIYSVLSFMFIIIIIVAIRQQIIVDKNQYFTGMIPHHSMAVMLSKKLLENHKNNLTDNEKKFVQGIIMNQEKEIRDMKKNLFSR